MARKPTGNPVGAPRKEIDWHVFEELCGLQCTQSEISSVLKVNEDTLRKRCKDNYGEDYSALYKKYSETGKTSLRRYQFIQAKTNTAMAIWLGKQWLGQKDKSKEEIDDKEHSLRELIRAVGDINAEARAERDQQRELEIREPLLHQDAGRKEEKIPA